jgi:hypothetical protein
MAIALDIYTFDAQQLIEALLPNVELADNADTGYSTLRLKALKLYEENVNLRMLFSDYGGWDRASLEAQFPADKPDDPSDTAFWMFFFVLNQMTSINRHAFRLSDIAQRLQWETADIHLIHHGRSLKEFVQRYVYKTNDVSVHSIPSYWEYVHPVSTGGRLGWLSIEDVETYLRKLESTAPGANDELQNKVNSTKDLLSSIHQQGLCIGVILSG